MTQHNKTTQHNTTQLKTAKRSKTQHKTQATFRKLSTCSGELQPSTNHTIIVTTTKLLKNINDKIDVKPM
jgi:hypothetical protein